MEKLRYEGVVNSEIHAELANVGNTLSQEGCGTFRREHRKAWWLISGQIRLHSKSQPEREVALRGLQSHSSFPYKETRVSGRLI